jgi:hypothetical protein
MDYECAYQRFDIQEEDSVRSSTGFHLIPENRGFTDYVKLTSFLGDKLFDLDKKEKRKYQNIKLFRVNYPLITTMDMSKLKNEAKGLSFLIATDFSNKTKKAHVSVYGATGNNDDILSIREHLFRRIVDLKRDIVD